MADTALNGEVPDEVDEEDEVESEDSDAEPNMVSFCWGSRILRRKKWLLVLERSCCQEDQKPDKKFGIE